MDRLSSTTTSSPAVQQVLGQVAADEAGAAGDCSSHCSLSLRGCRTGLQENPPGRTCGVRPAGQHRWCHWPPTSRGSIQVKRRTVEARPPLGRIPDWRPSPANPLGCHRTRHDVVFGDRVALLLGFLGPIRAGGLDEVDALNRLGEGGPRAHAAGAAPTSTRARSSVTRVPLLNMLRPKLIAVAPAGTAPLPPIGLVLLAVRPRERRTRRPVVPHAGRCPVEERELGHRGRGVSSADRVRLACCHRRRALAVVERRQELGVAVGVVGDGHLRRRGSGVRRRSGSEGRECRPRSRPSYSTGGAPSLRRWSPSTGS